MPTYEYRCPKGHDFELFQRMSDEPRAACPECGKTAERLLSGGAGLIFKGEGFYITDYRSEAYKKAASSDKEAASPEKKPSSGGSGKESSAGAGSSDGGSSKSKGASSDAPGVSSGSKSSDSGKSSQSET
jgi:putative FmdB family regulatory protein